MDNQQTALWNGPSGQAWVAVQEVLDRLFQPFEDLLVKEVSATAAASVLDIGCGTGATTMAAARVLGPNGRAVGIDISEPMLAVARTRAEQAGLAAAFLAADAQTYAFVPATFDLLISRFGVMFFDDPVAAFANLRHATRPGGHLRAIAWRRPADNAFMTTAEKAAAPFLPQMPARKPDGPGQFGFADRTRVQGILDGSGWRNVEVRAIDVACAVPEEDLLTYVTRLGPVGQMLRQADDQTRDRVIAAVRPAFAPFVDGAVVRFTSGCWMICAQA